MIILLNEMGPMKNEEKKVLTLFIFTVLLWISRKYIINPFIPDFDDSMIAISCALILFIIPSSERSKPLMKWKDAITIPWGILLLFGGGLSIANAFQKTELDKWIGEQLEVFSFSSSIIALLIIIAAVNFLTEMTSNMATTAMLLPVMIPVASILGLHPFLLLVGTTMKRILCFHVTCSNTA